MGRVIDRFRRVPPGPRWKAMVALPLIDFKMDVELHGALVSILSRYAGHVIEKILCGQSNIGLARNTIANDFVASDCTDLVMIDGDISLTLRDFEYLMEGPEPIVIAGYPKKRLGGGMVTAGAGFARVNRSVFENLNAWLMESGEEALHRYRFEGALHVDYFYNGASPDMSYFSEDAGFWHWCRLRDIPCRFESRCHLGHIGRFVYREEHAHRGSDMSNGEIFAPPSDAQGVKEG